ncbi:PASTA domain-containing protein [Granulicella mallensis]|uniref:Beta-lactam-binding protein with PASTA domain n=1 Tax=Granulicella mallensis TaxID=940614 RepID=A0A7W7ZR74_9BACT|nr:PASTA domain-containing protein [Granulicella mallensis]MBB5064257.1 beta-lactam-binding protein with PASTA domain [Granulicella mallensis]
MKQYFQLALTALSMIAVILISAALTLRIALHGHELSVPNFSGMTVPEASDAALRSGLDLTIENRFYSTTVPAGRMLSQAPAAGSRVRRGWQVRVTESLGPQQVTIPDVAGEPLRQASMDIRRMSLDLGTMAHIDAPGAPDVVLAQTPPPNAGVDQPRVSLLLSSTANGASSAFVLPSFVGLSYSAANHAAAALGLRVWYIADTPPAPVTPKPPQAGGIKLDANGQAIAISATPAAPAVPAAPVGPVTGQKPESGYRVNRGDAVRLIFGHTVTQGGNQPGN